MATYAAVVLRKWCFKVPQSLPILENLEILMTYTGTRDEEWFYSSPWQVNYPKGPPFVFTVTSIQTSINKCISSTQAKTTKLITVSHDFLLLPLAFDPSHASSILELPEVLQPVRFLFYQPLLIHEHIQSLFHFLLFEQEAKSREDHHGSPLLNVS